MSVAAMGLEGERRWRERTPGEGWAAPIHVTAVRMVFCGKASLSAAKGRHGEPGVSAPGPTFARGRPARHTEGADARASAPTPFWTIMTAVFPGVTAGRMMSCRDGVADSWAFEQPDRGRRRKDGPPSVTARAGKGADASRAAHR